MGDVQGQQTTGAQGIISSFFQSNLYICFKYQHISYL